MAGAYPVYYTPSHTKHDPPDHPDVPGRVVRLMQAAVDFGLEPRLPQDMGLAPIAAVHSPGLIGLLQTAYTRFAQLPEGPRPALPDCFAVRELAGHVPRSIWGQLGHYCADSVTPIMAETWSAAYWSTQVALSGAMAIDAGEQLAYALCRPPGHHAYRDLYGGYCYLNNAAIAAEYLVSRGRRSAILDIDYHHGNGTQAIFYDRSDVFFCSIHADPEDEYPYYCGFAHEMGSGEGEGYTLNLALPLGSGEENYLRALEHALTTLGDFEPDALLVSVGFDTLAGDPQGSMVLEPGSFAPIGGMIASLGKPILLIQEGGYMPPYLGPSLAALLEGITL